MTYQKYPNITARNFQFLPALCEAPPRLTMPKGGSNGFDPMPRPVGNALRKQREPVRSANPRLARAAAKGRRSIPHGQDISPLEIRAELERILSSSVFSAADRMRRFLRLVVEETIEGRGDNLNELKLGMTVYDRDGKFDPRVDSIVRVDAGRLRAKLREFYTSEETANSIAIEIPKGSYKAVFKRLQERDSLPPPRLRAKDPIAPKSLAVLPFADVSPLRDHDFLGDSIVDELIYRLSRIPGFRVVSLTSVLALKAKQIDVMEMGRQLGVESLVEGSVLQARHKIRVIVRLTDVATGFHTWSEVYASRLRDVFSVQERISNSIVEALSGRLGAKASVQSKNRRPKS